MSSSPTDATRTAVERFHQAVNSHDVDAVLAAMADDCDFESTQPPDGDRHERALAIGAFFAKHVRGVDAYRVRDGKIVEKLSYVKG